MLTVDVTFSAYVSVCHEVHLFWVFAFVISFSGLELITSVFSPKPYVSDWGLIYRKSLALPESKKEAQTHRKQEIIFLFRPNS